MALTVDDEREIEKLLIRYSYFLDSFLPRDEFMALFTEDAVLVSPISGRYVGRRGLEAFVDYRMKNTASWGPARPEQMRHFVSNFLIEGDGDTGFMRAFLLDYITRPDADPRTQLMLAGHYECDVVRVDGTWKLKSRILVIDTVSGGPDDNSDHDFAELSDQRLRRAISAV